MNFRSNILVSLTLIFLIISLSYAKDQSLNIDKLSPEEIMMLDVETLMNIQVTSVSKKSEKLINTAAAIFVITADDIRRMGATSIPETLRVVPGLVVARIDASSWAVSSRGFNGRFANKLLVLVDGRTVYSPVFAGVNWDAQDTMISDIARIEVIRGPGAAMWGANAVNGVINIITKRASETVGSTLTVGSGNKDLSITEWRYGKKIDPDKYFRIYTKYTNRDDFIDANKNASSDAWQTIRGGFRMDWEFLSKDSVTFQGDVYDGQGGGTVTLFTENSLTSLIPDTFDSERDFGGGNLLGRWERTFDDESSFSLQLYYDRQERKTEVLESDVDTFDIDFQHQFDFGTRHEIIWGLGYRLINDRFDNTFHSSFDPDTDLLNLYSAFIQDKITFLDSRLGLILGAKIEHNDFTGFEFQPNLRLVYKHDDRHSLWSAISRAVRVPARSNNVQLVQRIVAAPGPLVFAVVGDSDFESEELTAYEIGYRTKISKTVSVDIATFYNDYNNLRTLELNFAARPPAPVPATPSVPAHVISPIFGDNKMDGETYGAECSTNIILNSWWRVQFNYTFLRMQLHLDNSSKDFLMNSEKAEGDSPQQQFSIRSSMDLIESIQFETILGYVDSLPNQNINNYLRLELRLAWSPSDSIEISFVGSNLLDNQHPEFTPELINTLRTETERSFYGQIKWQF